MKPFTVISPEIEHILQLMEANRNTVHGLDRSYERLEEDLEKEKLRERRKKHE